MPAVTDLNRTGQRPADCFAIGTGPVPAHDLDTRVAAQPGFQHVGLAAIQDIDPLPGLGVDQDGRIFLACAPAGCRREAWLKKGLPSSK
jgi:hypothetical protein